MYADDIPGWFDAEGVAREPVGDSRISFSYRPELAEAIAVALTEPGHLGKIYDVTGAECVRLSELARIASETTGREYRYEPLERADWEEGWRARGKAPRYLSGAGGPGRHRSGLCASRGRS